MLVTDAEKINISGGRAAALPSVAVSREGRVYVSFIVDGESAVILRSSDGAESFEEVALIGAESGESIEGARVWIDGGNRLFVLWSTMPSARTAYCICADADADVLCAGGEMESPLGTLLARPLTLSDGTCLFASGVTQCEVAQRLCGERKRGIYVGRLTEDDKIEICNKPFGVSSYFDSISLVEQGSQVVSYLRAAYGIEKNVSADGAESFRTAVDSGFGGYDSRFIISMLPDKNMLFINRLHLSDSPEMHLSAMLSFNSKAFEGILPLDSGEVSTPDACCHDGRIYAVWARKEGSDYSVKLTVFTEQDILDADMHKLYKNVKIIYN